jgi:hypothetical protein
VQGYSIVWDTSASTLPDTTQDTAIASLTSPVLATDTGWYLHVRTCDNAGNWSSDAAHLGPFLIDTQAPSNPTVGSPSHTLSVWSADATVDVNWSGASDASGSGIDGYAVQWSLSPTTIPAAAVNLTGTSTTSQALGSANNWYFHIRTCDKVGNCAADAVHYGPFFIDTDAPTGSIQINNGALYTKDPSVSIALSATDLGIGIVSEMQLSEGSTVYDWEPYATSKTIDLSAGDGNKTVKVKYKDALGLISQEYSATILLDGTPPTSTITPLPTKSLAFDILVQWSASDTSIGSGVASYDVQYRIGTDGDWSDWLVGTTLTSLNFGKNPPVRLYEGKTYYFRVRARDKAGNVEDYPAGDAGTTWTIVNFKYLYLPIILK